MQLLPLALAAAGLTSAGCGGSQSSEPSPFPSGNETLITYTRSGGFAPVLERLKIQGDGDGTACSGFGTSSRKARSFTVPPRQLLRLREAIAAAPLAEVSKGTYVCADCFGYTVKTRDGEVTLSDIDFDSDSQAEIPPEAEYLFELLGKLAQQYVPGRQTPSLGG